MLAIALDAGNGFNFQIAKVNAFVTSQVTIPLLLGMAAMWNSPKTASLLLRAGVDPNGGILISPLAIAALEGHLEVARELIKAGADPAVANGEGHSPIFWACFNGHEDLVKLLTQYKTTPLQKIFFDKNGKETFCALFGLKKELFSNCKNLHDVMDRIFPPQ